MLCRHEHLGNLEPPEEMNLVVGHRYLCKRCGAVWDCAVCGHPLEETLTITDYLKAELETIVKEHLERSDG